MWQMKKKKENKLQITLLDVNLLNVSIHNNENLPFLRVIYNNYKNNK